MTTGGDWPPSHEPSRMDRRRQHDRLRIYLVGLVTAVLVAFFLFLLIVGVRIGAT